MALPATLKQLGAISGLIITVLVGMLTEKSIEIILRFSRAVKTSSQSGLAGDSFCAAGDVLSETWSLGVHHTGVMEEWFGLHWWTTHSYILLLTTMFVFAPLISFKRAGEYFWM